MEFKGIRQRVTSEVKSSIDKVTSSYNSTQQNETGDRALNMETLKQVQEQVTPVFVFLASILEKIEPIADAVFGFLMSVWTALEPYNPEDLLVAIYGFFLVFFGGIFMTLVASAEAAHQFGWDRIKLSLKGLCCEWTNARRAFEQDNKVRSQYLHNPSETVYAKCLSRDVKKLTQDAKF